jgi:sterol desaturase/sphingolipid hydroxylase (fatty acid hydroxylase superfamily)
LRAAADPDGRRGEEVLESMTVEDLALVRTIVATTGLLVLFGLETWLPFHQGRSQRLRHGLRNLALSVLNGTMVVVLFAAPLTAAASWAGDARFGLLNMLALPPFATAALAVLLFDLWMYAWHRATHRIPFLWRFHRMHHSDQDMDVTSAVRFHAGEVALSSGLRMGVLVLLGMDVRLLLVYEVAMLPIIQLHHSNVRLPRKLDALICLIFPSPNMHRIHHSVVRSEHDGNYGSIFSFWDRLFGSFHWRPDPERVELGLRDFKDARWLSLWGMLRTPLR